MTFYKTTPLSKAHPVPQNKANGEIDSFHDGFPIGSRPNSTTSMADAKAANRHDGIVIGGSITKGRKSVPPSSINKLPKNPKIRL